MLKPVVAIALACTIAGCQSSREGANDPESPVARTMPVDQSFVADAASGGMLEVQTGQLAAQNASRDELKQFGEMMVADHTKANARLKAAAAKDGVTVPDAMLPADQKTVQRLSSLRGAEFDAEYARVALDSHERSVAAFEQEAKQGKQPALKAFATETLPTLRQHLDHAKGLLKKAK